MFRVLWIIAAWIIWYVALWWGKHTKYYCPHCWSEDIFINGKTRWIILCKHCNKFGKFLPPDSDGVFRKSCCNDTFNYNEDEKYIAKYGCNNCLEPLDNLTTDPNDNPKSKLKKSKEHWKTVNNSNWDNYIWDINSSWKPHWYWTMEYSNWDKYEWERKNWKKNGIWTYYFDNWDIYEWNYEKDEIKWAWKITYDDWKIYEGYREDWEFRIEKQWCWTIYDPDTWRIQYIFMWKAYNTKREYDRAQKKYLANMLDPEHIYLKEWEEEYYDVYDQHAAYLKSRHLRKNTIERVRLWRETHCWKCAKYITSRYNYKCTVCWRLVCRRCWACWCWLPEEIKEKLENKYRV